MSKARAHFKLGQEVKIQFLHHLRHLLRECSYLPDPAAKIYFQNHVLNRFRDYRPRKHQGVFWRPAQKWILDERHQAQCLHECRKKVSFLYRAGMGDVKALTRVLYNTYGRSGKRRHQLLAPYLAPELPKDAQAEQAKPEIVDRKLELPSAIKLLGATQAKQQEVKYARVLSKFAKYTDPVLPATNNWGREMPTNRIENAKRRRYNELLEKLLPPLPDDEWERLRKLAVGETSFPGPPSRRTRLPGLPELPPVKRRNLLTARSMRRLWQSVLVQCPRMKWDSINQKWEIVWSKLETVRPKDLIAASEQTFLFEPIEPNASI